jgi:hypothetical protein
MDNNNVAPRVALVSGFWAQNIGNAYFNIGGKWILEQVFGEGNVQFIQDQPGYRTFYKQHKGNPKNDVALTSYVDVDYVVLQGPLMTTTFRALWEPAFKIYKERGIKVILLGCAFFKYTEEEKTAVKKFLDEYPPALISTRDSRTYSIIKDWHEFTFDGLDSAFFVPKAFNPIKFDFGQPYMTFNFDRFPEPNVIIRHQEPNITKDKESLKKSFEAIGRFWDIETPKTQYFFSEKGKSIAYFGHLIDTRKLPKEIDGYKVIRPEHRYTPHMTHKIYQHPNSFVSDETFTYFSVYAGTSLTLADRVHACVMSLAYGNPAMLFTISPRQALFDRVGAHDIRLKPVSLDMDYLEQERQKELTFLKETIRKIESRKK